MSAHAGDPWAETNRAVDTFLRGILLGTVPSGTVYKLGKAQGFTAKMIEHGRDRNGIHYEQIAGRWLWFEPPAWASERATGAQGDTPRAEGGQPHSGQQCEHSTPIPNILERRADGLVMCVLCKLPVPLHLRTPHPNLALVR